MICSSEKRFFTSNLLLNGDWTPNRGATQKRGDVAAMVRIAGMETEPSGAQHFIGPQGVISITSATSSLTIGPSPDGNAGIFLQDRNALHCISTPKGPKLVLAMYCDGRACAPVDYRVIDPNATRVISKQDPSDECDVACAQRALGTTLPRTLQEEN